MGDIREDVLFSLLRRLVKINIYRRSRVIIDTLDDDEPNRSGQDRGEVKGKNEDKAEVESENKEEIKIERF